MPNENKRQTNQETSNQQDDANQGQEQERLNYHQEPPIMDNKHELGAHRDNQDTYRNDKKAWESVTLPEEQGMDKTVEKLMDSEIKKKTE